MSRPKIKIIFAGTPKFAVPSLEALVNDARFEVLGVITQTDKPAGRGQKMLRSAVGQVATTLNLPLWQPEKIKEVKDRIENAQIDFLVVVAYGQILPVSILESARLGAVNVHGSLLPRYRGAACLSAPILNGDHKSGVTIMLMDEGLDTGPILKQTSLTLDSQETTATLHDKLSNLGAEILGDVLVDFYNNKITPKHQDDTQSSYVSTLDKNDGLIDWSQSAKDIERQVRAYFPWPGSFTYWQEKLLKIQKAELISGQPGNFGEVYTSNKQLLVNCGQDSLNILELQLQGGKPLKAGDFLAGHPQIIGTVLGRNKN